MRRVIFLVLTAVISSTICFAQQNIFPLTTNEKVQIIESILTIEDLPNRTLIVGEKNDGRIFLSTENIASVPLPEIEGINFVLLDRKKLKKTKVDYGFFRFGTFLQDGQYVEVKFGKYFKPNDEWNGKGTLYKCKKLRGWICWEYAFFTGRVD